LNIIPDTTLLCQVDAVGLEYWIRKGRQDVDVGDGGLVINIVEGDQNRVVPMHKPKRDTTLHRWQK
jgi:hypothetical protein